MSLLAYDAAGNVIGTLDWAVQTNEHGDPLGVVDFAAHEAAGGEHLDIWSVEGAAGSKHWPEYLGGQAHAFRVELAGPPGRKRIAALVHRESGHRRERSDVEQAIRDAPATEEGLDLRHIVGGPDRPLPLDEKGRTAPRLKRERPRLPLMSARP